MSMAELMKDDSMIVNDSFAEDCSKFAETVEADVVIFLDLFRKTFQASHNFKRTGLLDVMAGQSVHIGAYILIFCGVCLILSNEYLPTQFHGITSPSVLWPILTIPTYVSLRAFRHLGRLERATATVYRELYMFVAARMELAGWIRSLAGLRGTRREFCHLLSAGSKHSRSMCFTSGLEDLLNTCDSLCDDDKIWDDLPSYPTPADSKSGSVSPHQTARTHDPAASPIAQQPSSRPESVKGSLDDRAMRAGPSSNQTVSGTMKALSSSYVEGSRPPDNSKSESGSDSPIQHAATEATPLLIPRNLARSP
ncbi:uncharacterized protein EV420DRAFT_1697757 [Desarmillaria tabescens]|uniref:Uncharacterized protein n=1 Tax=Armillaria tabescens TaxID=1929756 RepID=A0AA39N0K4_ARMTA|nr:uncharacterized protein EV420DRAFT_1697757 [Desarmillaria tabescens]KAK0452974.1 hypothetical protein EV420DRAFT_1697757 [Desarmillaria tabescens]